MKKLQLGAALIFALILGLGGASFEPAEAGDWYIGGGFRVGGVHFSLAYDHGHRYHRPYHYFRTKSRVRYEGHRCGRYCFKRSRYTYHHAACPLVLHHFRLHRFHPARAWDYVRRPYPYHRNYYGDRYYSHRGHRDHHGDRYYSHRGHRDYYGYDYDRDSDSDSDSY